MFLKGSLGDMKNIKNITIATLCCLGLTLNACQLTVTNDTKFKVLIRSKNSPNDVLYMAPQSTVLTMDLEGDDPALEFLIEGKKKGRYVEKYTLRINYCALAPQDNIINFSKILSFAKKPSDRFVAVREKLNNYAFAARAVMKVMYKQCDGNKFGKIQK